MGLFELGVLCSPPFLGTDREYNTPNSNISTSYMRQALNSL